MRTIKNSCRQNAVSNSLTSISPGPLDDVEILRKINWSPGGALIRVIPRKEVTWHGHTFSYTNDTAPFDFLLPVYVLSIALPLVIDDSTDRQTQANIKRIIFKQSLGNEHQNIERLHQVKRGDVSGTPRICSSKRVAQQAPTDRPADIRVIFWGGVSSGGGASFRRQRIKSDRNHSWDETKRAKRFLSSVSTDVPRMVRPY